jgi:ATP-binding cassette subfamily F protein 3
VYPGNYEDYQRRKAGVASPEQVTVSTNGHAPVAVDTPAPSTSGAERTRKLNPIKLKQMRERLTFVEEEIPRIEAAISHTESSLGNYVSMDETQRLTALLEDLREQHATLNVEWEELMMQLEEQTSV